MSQNQPETLTPHAMLVVWGQFAKSTGLIDQIQSVSLRQKTVEHSPQRKILEFLVAIPSAPLRASLAGLEHLQDLSRSAHPIDQDQAVAKAWGQAGWADYSMRHLKVRSTPAIFLQEQFAVFAANFVRKD